LKHWTHCHQIDENFSIDHISQNNSHISITMKDSRNYHVLKLKKSENYESWKKNIINVLKVKNLWMIISKKLKKSTSLSFNVLIANKKKYITDVQHWEDRNNKVSDIIDFSCEKRFRIHIIKAESIIKMWFILKTQYKQLNLITLFLFHMSNDFQDRKSLILMRELSENLRAESWKSLIF